ncbi:MAG: hypothetical protein ACOYN0_08860 [Phycisphaerales bacterium]
MTEVEPDPTHADALVDGKAVARSEIDGASRIIRKARDLEFGVSTGIIMASLRDAGPGPRAQSLRAQSPRRSHPRFTPSVASPPRRVEVRVGEGIAAFDCDSAQLLTPGNWAPPLDPPLGPRLQL